MQTRDIRVFISSTFNDMHPERDWLVKRTFPRLREIAATRGVTLTEVDLRWGITEKEAKEGKTIAICLDEIVNSRPFFIGLLGNRYGWTPKPEELCIDDLPERYSWLAEDLNNRLSITEIEMQYGVLRNPEKIFASFYIREGGSDDDPRLTTLKEAVLSQDRYDVEYYSSTEGLGKEVEKQFISILDELYPEEDHDPMLAIRMNHLTWAKVSSRYYLPDPRSLAAIDRFLASAHPGKLLVTGTSGTGKSALLSFITAREAGEPGRYVIAHFPVAAKQSDSAELKERLEKECNAAPADSKLIVIVDDAATITDAGGNTDLSWIDSVPANAYLIISVADGQGIAEALKNRSDESLTVLPLLLSQRRQLADNYFKSFSKHLEETDLEIIGRPSKVTDNTLAYVTLLEELRCFGSFERLPEYIGLISGLDSASEFYDFLLSEKERFYATENYPDMVRDILSYLAVSAEGLTELELCAVSAIPQMYISQFVLGNTFLIKRNGGVLYIAHSRIEAAVINRYLNDEDYEFTLRENIIDYFESQEADSRRRDIELPFQYLRTGNDTELYLYVSKIQYLKSCLEINPVSSLRYWSHLLKISPTIFPVEGIIDSLIVPSSDSSPLNPGVRQMLNQACIEFHFSNTLVEFSNLLISHLHDYKAVGNLAIRVLCILDNNSGVELRRIWLGVLASAAGGMGNFSKALQIFATAMKESEDRDMKELHILLGNIAETYMKISEATHNNVFFRRAADIQRMVLDYRIEEFGLHHDQTAVAMDNLAGTLYALGEIEEAERLSEESLKVYSQLYGENSIDVIINLANIGNRAIQNQDFAKAHRIGKKIENSILELGDPDNLHLLDAYMCQAAAFLDPGKTEEMTIILKKFVDFIHRNPAASHNTVILTFMIQQASKCNLHNFVEEIADFWESIGFNNDTDHGFCLNVCGKSLLKLNRLEQGKENYNKAAALYINSGNYKYAVSATMACACDLSLIGKVEESAEWFRKGLYLLIKYDIEEDEQLAYYLHNYAVTLYNVGRYEEAVENLQRACDIRLKLFGEDDEMLNELYLPLLRKLSDRLESDELTNDSNQNSFDTTSEEIFSRYTDNPDFISLFRQGMEFFRKGSMSHALQIFSRLKQNLYDTEADMGAVSWVIRTMAYLHEIINTEEGFNHALELYDEATNIAGSTGDDFLLEKVAHDHAEFLWNTSHFIEAIEPYSELLIACFKQYGAFALPTMQCIGNIGTAMLKSENPDFLFVLNCGCIIWLVSQAVNNQHCMEWGDNLLNSAIGALEINAEEFRLQPVKSIAEAIDYFVDRKLYRGAWVLSCLFSNIPEQGYSHHDVFLRNLAISRVGLISDPENSISFAMNAVEISKEYPEEITEKDKDAIFRQLSRLYMTYCCFNTAGDYIKKITNPDDEDSVNNFECAFITGQIPISEEVFDYINNSNITTTHQALMLILALQRAGAETEAHELFSNLLDISFDNIYKEMQRLYAIVSYLREAGLDDEADIYRKAAVAKFDLLSETNRRLFTKSFSEL